MEALTGSLTSLVSRLVKQTFDLPSIAREVGGGKETSSGAGAFVYKSRARNEPTTVTMPAWAAVLWTRLESLIGEMGDICTKVRTVQGRRI